MRSFELCGGLLVDGKRIREVQLCDITGALEMFITDVQASCLSLPKEETAILTRYIGSIGPISEVTEEHVTSLLSVDRKLLLKELSIDLKGESTWLLHQCNKCGKHFDLYLDWRTVPCGVIDEFPTFVVECGKNEFRFSYPTGDTEILASTFRSRKEAIIAMLRSLLHDSSVPLESLGNKEISDLITAVDEKGSVLAEEIQTSCPECQASQKVMLDFSFGLRGESSLLGEIHVIAKNYHWAERDILSLSRKRRQQYLSLITAEQYTEV